MCPRRAYKVSGHSAFRLTYRTAGNEYWGIQELGWADPPILDGASVTQTIKGRRVLPVLQRLEAPPRRVPQNGASYWVVNTLLDRLSNETMLAIAKGLRPLGSK